MHSTLQKFIALDCTTQAEIINRIKADHQNLALYALPDEVLLEALETTIEAHERSRVASNSGHLGPDG